MNTTSKRLAWCLCGLACLAPGAYAAEADAQSPMAETWTTSVSMSERTQTQGISLAGLDKKDWFHYVDSGSPVVRAVSEQEVLMEWTHASGWRVGAFHRARATVSANADTARLAKVLETSGIPQESGRYGTQVQGESWQGAGIKIGTPWWPVADTTWQWRADWVAMGLNDWRQSSLAGTGYVQAGVQRVDLYLQGSRSGRGIGGPFLGMADRSGLAWSMSLDVRATVAPGWTVQMRASDLVSQLRWNRLASESLAIDTAIEQRRPDGYIDYAPAVKGRQLLGQRSGHMGPGWQGVLNWQLKPLYTSTLSWQRVGGLSQLWLGMARTSNARDGRSWAVATDLERRAIKGRVQWGPLFLEMATATRNTTALRQVQFGMVLAH